MKTSGRIPVSASDFPALAQGVHYLDSASSALTPQSVIDAVQNYYAEYPVNVHRGLYTMSERATAEYEAVREQVRAFLNAAHTEEILFTSGTTDSINRAARFIAQTLQPGDEIIVTRYEHHANLIPWQLLAQEMKLQLRVLEPGENGTIEPDSLRALINENTRVLAITAMSNVCGYRLPVEELCALAKEYGATTVVDAAQLVQHESIDVQAMQADYLAFSAHKLGGPTGCGVLYGKRALLEAAEPISGGGGMIDTVTMESSTWASLPAKHEPGTPHIAGVLGLGAALHYWNTHAQTVQVNLREALGAMPGVTLYGPTSASATVAFSVDGIHAHDLASIADTKQVAIRAGHHCAQPLLRYWGVQSVARASAAAYTTQADIDALIASIQHAQSVFEA